MKNILPSVLICFVIVIFSCSDKPKGTNADTLKKNLNLELNSSSQSTNKIKIDWIKSWDSIRKDSIRVANVFEKSGNMFSFEKDSMSTIIHAYMGYEKAFKRLHFILVTAEQDSISNNLQYLEQDSLTVGNSLPKLKEIKEMNSDSIKWSTANRNINNWSIDSIRNKWISQRFQKPDSIAIFQAFVIKAVDFEYGTIHKCYLSLNETDNSDGSISYEADLVIVNSKTNEIVSFNGAGNETGNLENLTRPVPPFTTMDTNDFGTLNPVNKN